MKKKMLNAVMLHMTVLCVNTENFIKNMDGIVTGYFVIIILLFLHAKPNWEENFLKKKKRKFIKILSIIFTIK